MSDLFRSGRFAVATGVHTALATKRARAGFYQVDLLAPPLSAVVLIEAEQDGPDTSKEAWMFPERTTVSARFYLHSDHDRLITVRVLHQAGVMLEFPHSVAITRCSR